MKVELVSKTYKCEGVELENAVVSADNVTVQDGKIVNIDNGSVTVKIGEEKMFFSFTVYNQGKAYNLNNAPAEVDGRAIIMAFIAAVEAEIV
ncbi:MAG: glycosyltransferase [Bacteroidales bacterium]|nr:glycosyltransferase [Bacteroidales bacterium]